VSTNGAFGFRIGGVDKVTYNHSDSYPDGLGSDMVEYVGSHSDEQLRAVAEGLRLVDPQSAPTAEDVRRFKPFSDTTVGNRSLSDWYCLLRHAQRDPGAWDRGLDVMIDGASFLKDSVCCMWAYIINVDDGALEVYEGFNKDPKAPGRYAALFCPREGETGPPAAYGGGGHYYGVALKASVPFKKLRAIVGPVAEARAVAAKAEKRLEKLYLAWAREPDEDEESVAEEAGATP